MVDIVLVLMLAGFAAVIAAGLAARKPMWRLIVWYWLILTVRNLLVAMGEVGAW